MDINFEIGQRYTVFYIDSCMAMTHRREITVKAVEAEGSILYTIGRERSMRRMKMQWQDYQNGPTKEHTGAILPGWGVALQCDTDQRNGIMRGNACFNFLGSVDSVRNALAAQINPKFDKGAVLAIDAEHEDGLVVYPEAVQRGNHAVIDGIMAKA